MAKFNASVNGGYMCNNFLRNIRSSYNKYTETGLKTECRRCFSMSGKLEVSEKPVYSFKAVFDTEARNKMWEEIKSQCNLKLILLGEILTSQCNFIASQRIRRMSQMWNLYTQLYSEKNINKIVSQIVKNLRSKRRPISFLLGSTLFCWEKEKITDEEIQHYKYQDKLFLEEFYFYSLNNINCISELDRYRRYDDHPTNHLSGQCLVKKLEDDGWEVVIQKEHIQVWRKAFPNSYLYEYKIMGTFYDVPARTFFAVQTDIEYRKKWDKLVIKLDVIDREDSDGGCEVMHWVMHYPYPMYSREYVYIRRAVISPETNTMVLVSRSISHPACPVDNKYVRVNDYTSRMVIRPHRTFDENGFDYVLTYFDDPQAAFPSPAYNWMARSGVPDFVEKLHEAARELHSMQQKSKTSPNLPSPSKENHTSNNFEYNYM